MLYCLWVLPVVQLVVECWYRSIFRIQEEREERHKLKRVCRGGDPTGGIAVFPETTPDRKTRFETDLDLSSSTGSIGMYDLTTDETSTNIYISSLNPKVCIQD